MANEIVHPMEDPEASLERALIAEFLAARGVDTATLAAMPSRDAERLLNEASMHAAAKLAEVEARARFVRAVHGVQ